MKKGDIILVPFYFTDFSDYKLCPALIVSGAQSNPEDYIVAFISTIISSEETLHVTHLIINSNESYFINTGLKKTSIIKCDKLMTIHQSIVTGLLGEIPIEILRIIDTKLKKALSLNNGSTSN